MTQSLEARFPQELVDAIIDVVRDSSPSRSDEVKNLSSCSLVARSFLPRTRSHLFYNVTFTTAEDIERYHAMCLASPIIPAAARRLGLHSNGTSNVIENPLLLAILKLANNIQTLVFHQISWDTLPQAVLDTISSYPLTAIMLHAVVIPSILSFFSFLRNCSTREEIELLLSQTLRVESDGPGEDLTVERMPRDKPLVVKRLIVNCPDTSREAIRAILLSASSPFNLQNLRSTQFLILHTEGYKADGVGTWFSLTLLRNAITSTNPQMLRSVEAFSLLQRPPSFLLYLPSVELLSFSLSDYPSNMLGFQPIAVLHWWIDILIHSKSYDLKELKVVAFFCMAESWIISDEALKEWARLDDVLSSPKHCNLKLVGIHTAHTIMIDDSAPKEEMVSALTASMPGLAKRRVLSIQLQGTPLPGITLPGV
ncbi:hypothetical protein ARMGADRAFT_1166102 [Armillaria gallica]|uniref:F-box domain-containing protein n=1 Tax=Armillaria gallica TaxID=47427 RepID=A0A2H3D9L7_ARMGA|nr:hypothetical protein ARMGADRAFT_1166102 [Armillaria gallica]